MSALFPDVFVYLFEASSLFVIIKSFINCPFQPIKVKFFLCIFLDITLSICVQHFLPELTGWFLGLLFEIIICKYLFKKSMVNTFIVYMLAYSLLSLIDILLLLFMPNTSETLNSTVLQLTGTGATLIIACIISRLLPLHKLYLIISSGNVYLKLLLTNLFVIILYVIAGSKLAPTQYLGILPLVALFAITLIMINLTVIHQQNIIQQQLQEIESYNTYQPIFEELIDQVRDRQHDFDNQIMAIKSLPLSYSDYPSLSDALNNYSCDIIHDFQCSSLLKLNLKLVAGFLFSKIRQAEKSGKHLNITVQKSILKSQVPEYELIKILGILIDNALEAIATDESAALTLDCIANKIIVKTTNTGPIITEELRTHFFQRGYTTKNPSAKEKHGLGLYNLLQLVRQYNGEIELYNSEFAGDILVHFIVTV